MAKLSELESSQGHAVGVLRAALRAGRLHHAYLLVGEERAGLALAEAAALALVCTNAKDGDACGECAPCRKLQGGNHPDVARVGPNERGSIAIDSVRDITARLSLRASESPTKIVILERADLMTPAAQNALLKTLEEPPGPTCFFLTVLRLRTLLPTIRSRSQTLRVVPQDRLHAWQALTAAGIDEGLARLLGPITGADTVRAQELVELGENVKAELERALAPDSNAVTWMRVAADLGADREHTDLAVAFLEVMVRDALAQRHNAGADSLYEAPRGTPAADLPRVVAKLQELRRLSAINLNRTLALESVFFSFARN